MEENEGALMEDLEEEQNTQMEWVLLNATVPFRSQITSRPSSAMAVVSSQQTTADRCGVLITLRQCNRTTIITYFLMRVKINHSAGST